MNEAEWSSATGVHSLLRHKLVTVVSSLLMGLPAAAATTTYTSSCSQRSMAQIFTLAGPVTPSKIGSQDSTAAALDRSAFMTIHGLSLILMREIFSWVRDQ